MSPVRILLADDHTVMRNGLRLLLERQPHLPVIGEAADGREAVCLGESANPDVVIMDIAMPNLNGIEATRQIVRHNPRHRHRHSQHALRRELRDSRAEGRRTRLPAEGFRRRPTCSPPSAPSPRASLSSAQPSAGSWWKTTCASWSRSGVEDTYELLTTREREILQLLAEGKTNKEVAAMLNLSMYTVETHRTHILQKLNLHNVPELILYAVRKGIIA